MLRPVNLFVSLVVLSVFVGCSAGGNSSSSNGGGGGEGGDSSGSSGSGSTSSGMGGSSSSGSGSSSVSSGSGSGGGAVVLSVCKQGCATANDCIINGGGAAYDVDNYACNKGACDYTGCNSDAECTETFPNLGYVCRTSVPGYPAGCIKGCVAASDCAINGAGPAYDADNYTCSNGGCQYKGCNSDAECQFAGPQYICKSFAPGAAPACYTACQTAADCPPANAGPAFDVDNYSCSEGFCKYDGCNSDGECDASFPKPGYVCR